MSLGVLDVEAPVGANRAALERLLLGRADVGAALSRTLLRLGAAWDSAEIELWAEGALDLVHANAGGRSLVAFLRLTDAHLRQHSAASLAADARGAADIARHAGSAASLASLEATPVAMLRFPGRQTRWWSGLCRLARDAPNCVSLVAANAPTILAACDGEAFENFIAAGLKAAGRDRARQAAFFSLANPAARRLLERAGGKIGFEDVELRLKVFGRALWGACPRLAGLEGAGHAPAPQRVSIVGDLVRIPHIYRGVAGERAEPLYRAALAHAQAHLAYSRRQPVGKLKPLQLALIGLVEDARAEALAIRRFPGLRALWTPWHEARPGDAMTAAALMARLSRALLDPAYQDDDGFVAKGRRLFAEADGRLDDPLLARAVGGLLGNDLGQMRLRFDAKAYVVEPLYRDDNLALWELDDQPDEQAQEIEQAVEAARPTPKDRDEGRRSDEPPKEKTGRAREVAADERGPVLATYPEWDRALGAERPAWTTVRDAPAPLGDAAALETRLDQLGGFGERIARLVRGARIGRAVRLKRQHEGFDLDLDAAVDAAIALRTGDLPDERIHRASAKRARDVATVVLVDVSESTRDRIGATSVLEIETLAVAALGRAMDALGDAFAIRAFASCGRDDVRLIRIKDFQDRFDAGVMARLAGVAPGLSTRMGAALRHVGAELESVRAHRKLVIALTDGEPSDIDVADPLDLAEDARRATLALRRRGVDVFGVTLGAGQSHAVFGRANTIPARRLEELPARLSELYFRLARL